MRKNFFPTLVVTVGLWGIIALVVYFVDPNAFGAAALLFFLIFFALLFTFSTIFANTRRGLIVAIFLSLFLLLRYFGVGHFLNFLLLTGIVIAAELYFSK